VTAPHPHPSSTLDALDRAYRAGDFVALRRLARQVVSDPQADLQTREAAEAYCTRIAVEPWAAVLLGFAALLFCAIVARYVF
jgi:hypothetical protein